MKPVYNDSSIPEKEAKKRFCFPENIMMENAAAALESCIEHSSTVLVLCGTGNNGGDGYALSRRIYKKVSSIDILAFGEPKTDEAKVQAKMCKMAGVKIWQYEDFENLRNKEYSVIVDCIFGTGFHGELPEKVRTVIEWANGRECYRLACDVPSGLKFIASKTVTMGALKSILLKDEAKDYCGEIEVADMGISSSLFESCAKPDAFLLEEADVKLPVRTRKSVHKGDFGHASVIMGEKAGAAVIAGTAALSFGAGLVTEVDSGLCGTSFMMNPELMISDSMPERTSAVLLGSGLGRSEKSFAVARKVIEKVCEMKNPSVVLDADFFYYESIAEVLERLNSISGASVILTPHPKELHELLRRSSVIEPVDSKSAKHITGCPRDSEITVSDVCIHRFEYARQFAQKFPNLVLVSKGADSYISAGKSCFICDRGTNALAKAGSGDVLAGLCAALLAQGYSAVEAAKTAVFAHAEAACSFERSYECTPLKLAEYLGRM